MALPITIDVALSAVEALLRFRDRVDNIMALKEAAADLPFVLPPAPDLRAPHIEPMVEFFASDEGQLLLAIHRLEGSYKAVLPNPRSGNVRGHRNRLLDVYFDANEIAPEVLGPREDGERDGPEGPSAEMRLAYYVVVSDRLSRNPALTRVLLATADTLLEVAGANANLFIKNPRTRSFVESLLNEFAVKQDFDDLEGERIFKSLLGSTIIAATENADQISDHPAASALFAALSELRKDQDLRDPADFVANLISREGFQRVLGSFLVNVAEDPSFLVKDEILSEVIGATLKKIGQNLPEIVDDPAALAGVLEAGLAVAAAHASKILERDLDGVPLLAAVLSTVANEVADRAGANQLFDELASGDLIPAIYRGVLERIAADPSVLGIADIDGFIAQFVSGVAEALSQQELANLLSVETLQLVASEALLSLADHPELLVRDNEFAAKVLEGVLRASTPAIRDGLQPEDLLTVINAAIVAAAENLALLNISESIADILGAFGEALQVVDLRDLLSGNSRRESLLMFFETVASNPAIWAGFQERDLVRPLVLGILQGLRTDPTHLISGPIMVEALRQTLSAAARRGREFIAGKVTSDDVRLLLTQALAKAEEEIGQSIDGENVGEYLKRLLQRFVDEPFDLAADPAAFDELASTVTSELRAA